MTNAGHLSPTLPLHEDILGTSRGAKVTKFEITWFAKLLSLQNLLEGGHIIPPG